MSQTVHPLLLNLNALAAGAFLIAAFGIVATRQMLACLRWFVAQATLLAISATAIGIGLGSAHLFAVAAITLATKTLATPWLLRRTVRADLYGRREISQHLNIPTSLLIAAALTLFAYALAAPLGNYEASPFAAINMPVGLAGLFVGAFTVAVRREALSQLLGLLAMENGAFMVAVAVVPNLTFIAELAVAFDVPVTTLVIGLLTRRIHERLGGTSTGLLAALRER